MIENSKSDSLFSGLPGAELVRKGLDDLALQRTSEEALLLQVCAPRLRRLGIAVLEQQLQLPCEHRLYEFLEDRYGAGAYSRYNSLLRRIVSFSQALEREAGQQLAQAGVKN